MPQLSRVDPKGRACNVIAAAAETAVRHLAGGARNRPGACRSRWVTSRSG